MSGLKGKLIKSHFLIAMLGALLLVLSLMTIVWLRFDLEKLSNESTPLVQATEKVQTNLQRSLAALRGWMNLRKKKFIEERESAWRHGINPSLTKLTELNNKTNDTARGKDINELKKMLNTLNMWQWRIEDVSNTDGNHPGQLFLKQQIYPAAYHIISISDILINNQKNMAEANPKLVYHMLAFKNDFVLQLSEVANHILTGSNKSLVQAKEHLLDASEQLESIKADGFHFDERNKSTFRDLIIQVDFYSTLLSKLIAIKKANSHSLADQMLAKKAAPLAHKASSLLTQMINLEDSKRNKIVSKTSSQVYAIIYIITIFVIILLSLSLWLAIRNAKKLLHPIKLLTAATNKIASGERNENLPVASKDEIGNLTQSFNEMLHAKKIADEKILQTVEAAVDAIITIDKDGIIQSCNTATTDMLGYTRNELLKNNVSILMPEPYHREHDSYLKAYLKTKTKHIIGKSRELIAQSKSGETIPIKLSVSEIKVGTELLFVGIIQDIREEKSRLSEVSLLNTKLGLENKEKALTSEIEKTLRAGNSLPEFAEILLSFFASHFNFLLSMFYSVDATTKTIHLVQGYGFKEKRGRKTVLKWGEGLVGQAVRSKEPIIIDNPENDYFKICSGLGEKLPKYIMIKPLVYKDEVISVVELSSLDEMKNTDLALAQRMLEDVVIILNAVISKDKLMVLVKETEKQKQYLQQQEEELRSTNEELESQSSQLKQSEEEMRSINEELNSQIELIEKQKEDLNIKSKEINKSSQYKSEFISNMSHELRTPLNSLLILAERFKKNKGGNLTTDQIEEATIIYQSGNDLLALINDILDISKVEAGKLLIEYVKIDLDDMLTSIERQFKHVADNKGIKFQLDKSALTTKSIYSDSLRLTQILKNLLSNALKFTEKGEVILRVKQIATEMVFEVIDSGIGIPKNLQESIFSAFQQADGSTSRKYGGTGLGLSISKKLAQLMQGDLSLVSEKGAGSTFTLALPMVDPANRSEQVPAQDEITKETTIFVDTSGDIPQPIPDDRDKLNDEQVTVLIIDDDKQFIDVISKFMHEEEFNVLKASNAKLGIQLAIAYRPDGIILDLGLPDISGKKVLNIIKQDKRTTDIPIHIISAEDKSSELIKNGAVSFLQKPIREQQIHDLLLNFSPTEKKCILIIEDDIIAQTQLKETFASFSDSINIDVAINAKQAKEKLSTSNYMCVIVDLGLPDVSGISLISTIVNDMKILIPIVVYTARELSLEEFKEIRQYTDTVIVKGPKSTERLVDEVKLFAHHVQKKSDKVSEIKLDLDKPIFSKERILLVDDDIRNSFSLSRSLEEEGLEVIIADTGKLAIEKLLSDNKISLILMDMMMPIMDGYEAIRKIRDLPQYKSLPIISLTARATKEDKKECLEIGANDFMSKPIDVDSLLELIKFWLSNVRATDE